MAPEAFFQGTQFSKLIRDVVSTAYEFPFKGLRIFTADAVTIAVDHQYTSNSVFAVVNVEDWTTTTTVCMDRRGRRATTPNVKSITRGVAIEMPLTMIISAMCQKEQILQTRQRDELSEAQKSAIAGNLQRLNDQLSHLMNDEPSIMLMGEQALAIDNGDVYFHQPVSVNWLSFVEQVDFTAAPTFMQTQLADYRARSIDVFKGVKGIAGTLEEIELQLDQLGIGSHLKNTPWVKLPDKAAFDLQISEGMRQFIRENARFALGMFGQYIRTSMGNIIANNKDISRSMSDMALKLKRLGADTDFELDSQDYSAVDVAARAFKHVLNVMSTEEREKVLVQAGALLDLRYGRINFDVDMPDQLTREDITFYKKAIALMRRDVYDWPKYLVDATVLNQENSVPFIEMKLPSGMLAQIKVMESNFFGFYDDFALEAIRNPVQKVVHDMVDFIEQIEGLFLYLDSKEVTVNHIVPDLEGDVIRVGGMYRKLSDILHPSIASPNFVTLVPVGKVNYV